MHFSKSACALVGFALSLVHSQSQGQISFNVTTVAAPGESVPVPSELRFVYSATLNDAGQVAFWADYAVFLQSDGVTRIIASFGDSAPDGGTFIDAYGPVLNGSGQILFAADLASPGRSGLFVSSENSIQSIVQIGDPAPGGGTLTSLYEYSLNDSGDVAFSALTESGEGLFLFSGGTLSQVARAGDPAPRGNAFSSFYSPAINASRQIAFASYLDNSDRGIFLRNADGTLSAVVRDGDPSPGGAVFYLSATASLEHRALHPTGNLSNRPSLKRRFEDGAGLLYPDLYPAINDAGTVAFPAYATNGGGIFTFSNGALRRQIRDGDPAPGGGFLSFPYFPVLNSMGAIAFRAMLSDSYLDAGVFLFSGGVISEVVRPHRPSPEGDRFTYVFWGPPALNSAGQVSFQSELENSLGGTYLFSKGNITRIAGQGDPIDREPKLLNGRPEAINAAGAVVFRGQSFPGDDGLFDGSSSSPIVREGDPAPEGGVFDYVYSLATYPGRSILFASTSLLSTGIYSRSESGSTRIVGPGDPAPGGHVFSSIDYAAFNDTGEVAFAAQLDNTSYNGVFVFSDDQLYQLMASGDPAPGGGVFSYFWGLSLNDLGQMSFLAYVSFPSRYGVFLWSEGIVRMIVQSGDPAPGGGTFILPPLTIPYRYVPILNAVGQVVFAARVSSPTANPGVFLFSPGTGHSRIAVPGDPAPGGGTFARAHWASLNDLGEVAFAAILNPTGFGVYFVSQGTMSKIVATGDPAPSGAAFSHVDATKINSQGQVAFQGSTDLFSTNAVYLATPVR